MKTKIAVLGLALSSLLGCNSESVKNENLVPVEVEYKVPNSDVVQKKTIMVEKTKVYGDTLSGWDKKYNREHFCNGGVVYKVERHKQAAYTYPVIKSVSRGDVFHPNIITYYLCNVQTGEIINV